MSKVKVSDDLTKILKNFSTINKSIVIEPGMLSLLYQSTKTFLQKQLLQRSSLSKLLSMTLVFFWVVLVFLMHLSLIFSPTLS